MEEGATFPVFDQFDNPFMAEKFVSAGDGRISAGPVRRFSCGDYCFAYEVKRSAFALGCRVASFWAHGYAPIGGALLGGDGAGCRNGVDFSRALDHLALDSGADLIVWPYFPVEALERGLLDRWMQDRGAESLTVPNSGAILRARAHERAVLDARSEKGLSLSKKKAKEVKRQFRRLEDVGPVRFSSTGHDLTDDQAMDAFLGVEASGWKADKGTALAVDDNLQSFVDAFLPDMLMKKRARIDLLEVDEKAIAGCVSFLAGRGLFTWKIGMDEAYRRYSPGMQLMLALSRRAIADPDIDYIDSLADPGHPMVNPIWAGRRCYAHLYIPLNRVGAVACHSLRAGYVGKDRARFWAKKLLRRS